MRRATTHTRHTGSGAITRGAWQLMLCMGCEKAYRLQAATRLSSNPSALFTRGADSPMQLQMLIGTAVLRRERMDVATRSTNLAKEL